MSERKTQTISYPRTGKRGVPQQFPRRLYGMLEGEAKRARGAQSRSSTDCISWSESGAAFHIRDVDTFAAEVLPRYFRTSKFSSFQRNLNLYGFSKVRKGPDTDMYAHPCFVRGDPEALAQLRKASPSSRGRTQRASCDSSSTSGEESLRARSVSPSPTRKSFKFVSVHTLQAIPPAPTPMYSMDMNHYGDSQTPASHVLSNKPPEGGCGRLDLLAMALEREGCFAS